MKNAKNAKNARNSSQEKLREFVRGEARDGWSEDTDPDDYEWTLEWLPTRALVAAMSGGRRGWSKWYEEERGGRGGRSEEYWDELERLWVRDPELVGRIIVVERGRGLFDIGDGWHRTAISVVAGMHVVPAIVGRPIE